MNDFVCRKKAFVMYQRMKTPITKPIEELGLQGGLHAHAMALLQLRLTENSIWQNELKENEQR